MGVSSLSTLFVKGVVVVIVIRYIDGQHFILNIVLGALNSSTALLIVCVS